MRLFDECLWCESSLFQSLAHQLTPNSTSSTCKSRASILSSNANFSTALCSSSLILSPSLMASSMVPFSSRILDTLSSILPRVPRSPLRNPLLPLPPCLALRRFLLRLRMIQRSVVAIYGSWSNGDAYKITDCHRCRRFHRDQGCRKGQCNALVLEEWRC